MESEIEPNVTTVFDLVVKMKRAAQCVYLATDSSAADDIASVLIEGANRLYQLEADNSKLKANQCKC